ncbi:hypothetical protein H8356DRAFT_1420500 [Neocallimastix lanati (nom. inval.)]|nr:hypothetical protein H8356DRAFT_1420500 [Neocallimastix sp. JGI-2020a]
MQNEACSILFNNQHDYYNQPEQAMYHRRIYTSNSIKYLHSGKDSLKDESCASAAENHIEYFFARTNENKKAIEYFRKVNILINNMDNDMDSINNWIENKDEENKEENKDEENNKSIEGNKISCPVGYAIKIHDIFLEEESVIKKLKNKCESQLVTDIKNLCENKHYFYMEVSYQYVEDKMLSKSLNCRCDILCLNIPLVNLYNMLIFMDTPFFVDNKIIDYNRQVYTIKNYTSLKLCYSWANGDSTLVNPNIKLDNEIHLVISDDIIELNANIYLSLVDHSAVLHTLIEQNEEKHYVIVPKIGLIHIFSLRFDMFISHISQLIYPSNIVLQSTKNIAVLRTDYRRRMSQTYSTILIEGRHIYERNAILEISIVKWILRIMKDGGSIDCGITPFVKGMLVMPTYYRSGDCRFVVIVIAKAIKRKYIRVSAYLESGIHRLRWYNITLQEEGFHHINDVSGTSSISGKVFELVDALLLHILYDSIYDTKPMEDNSVTFK